MEPAMVTHQETEKTESRIPTLFGGIEESKGANTSSGKGDTISHSTHIWHFHGVLLFSQMTQTLDIFQVNLVQDYQDYLELRKYSYERLDGSIRAEERFAAIKSFSHNRSKFEAQQNTAFVFLI
ncbi:hypothetical protein KY284_000738 [Solanum tuberosum]|nr:hypothetical protein KY284_000738 [Solanum tuberosum]